MLAFFKNHTQSLKSVVSVGLLDTNCGAGKRCYCTIQLTSKINRTKPIHQCHIPPCADSKYKTVTHNYDVLAALHAKSLHRVCNAMMMPSALHPHLINLL